MASIPSILRLIRPPLSSCLKLYTKNKDSKMWCRLASQDHFNGKPKLQKVNQLKPRVNLIVTALMLKSRLLAQARNYITIVFHMIHRKRRRDSKLKWGWEGRGLLCVHNLQKYPGVRSYLTFTTAQEPTKVQCTNKKIKIKKQTNKQNPCKHSTINS